MTSVFSALLSRFGKTRRPDATPIFGYSNRFDNWLQAKGQTDGYQDPHIAKTVAAAAKKVLAGSAIYERDSVVFDHREFSFPLATALLWIASRTQGQLRVLDFGGGLGTSFFQNIPFTQWIANLEWSIVEQPSFVEQARALFVEQPLAFFTSLAEGIQAARPHLALLSSSLQYVETPYQVLREIVDARIEVVMIDRTLFSTESSDYATQQHVPQEIFSAVIPAWIFSQHKFVEFMQQDYRMLSEFPAFKSTANLDRDMRNLRELGYLFVLKGSDYDVALDKKWRDPA